MVKGGLSSEEQGLLDELHRVPVVKPLNLDLADDFDDEVRDQVLHGVRIDETRGFFRACRAVSIFVNLRRIWCVGAWCVDFSSGGRFVRASGLSAWKVGGDRREGQGGCGEDHKEERTGGKECSSP